MYLIGRGGGEAGRIAGYRTAGWTAFPGQTIGCSRMIPKRFPLELSKHPKGTTGLHARPASPFVRESEGILYSGQRPPTNFKSSKLLFQKKLLLNPGICINSSPALQLVGIG